MKSKLAIAAAAAALLSTSCIGPNNAFNGIHSWNSRVSDSKWVNELVHIGCWIIPVYGLALFGDIVLFNSIEFWGGENLVGPPSQPFQPVNKKEAK